ncbi:MAG: cytidylate kinase-like family protein [Ruminococcaceae bacterium]|nr:cytidylate kinase-like family protein [Oscillospiraceae bacterium]
MNNKYVITIGRQFGSGGRAIAQKLARKLSVPFYDKELISIAAKESGTDPDVFKDVDETATNSLLYSISMGMYSFGNGALAMGDLPVNDKLYLLQHQIIKELAEKESCVIVGRCADYILKDNPNCVNVFIHADIAYRKKRAVVVHNIEEKRAESIINKTDKTRANYYSFYTGQKWGQPQNYDLCIDSSKLTDDQVVDLICAYIELKG